MKLYEMGATPTGIEVSSALKYTLEHWPNAMLGLLGIYKGSVDMVWAWATGFAYALSVMEDNGMPIDLDEVLHGWEGDDMFPLADRLQVMVDEFYRNG